MEMRNNATEEFEAKRDAMLHVNVTQAQLYDEVASQKAAAGTIKGGVKASESRKNIAFRLWAAIKRKRRLVQDMLGLDNFNDRLHREWLHDAKGKHVLELGCNVGHENTFILAETAESYLGVDLSPKAIETFNDNLASRGLTKAKGIAQDFLATDFPQMKFDVVLARSVVHHFEHFEVFIRLLHSRMAPGGVVLTYDPLQTALSARIMRSLYRPFQKDKDWEWPLSKESFEIIDKYFEVEKVQGFLGRSKWAIPLAMVSQSLAKKFGTQWHARDMAEGCSVGPGLWPCLFVVMKLKRRELQADA